MEMNSDVESTVTLGRASTDLDKGADSLLTAQRHLSRWETVLVTPARSPSRASSLFTSIKRALIGISPSEERRISKLNVQRVATPSAADLFREAQTGSSGMVGWTEFQKVHEVMVRQANAELDAQKEALVAEVMTARESAVKCNIIRVAVLLGLAMCVMLLGNAGLTAAVVLLTRDTTMDDGMLMSNGKAVTTMSMEMTLSQPLTSFLPDEAFEKLRYFQTTSTTGAKIRLTVRVTLPCPRPHPFPHGSS